MSHVCDHTWNMPVNFGIPTCPNLSIFWKGYQNLPAEFALDNVVQTMKPCSSLGYIPTLLIMTHRRYLKITTMFNIINGYPLVCL